MDGVRHSGLWLQYGGGRIWHFALGWIWRRRFGWRRPRNARLAALGTDDLRFYDEVVGTTDHQQMFNIVASNNNKLALPVEVEGIDGPKPRLPGPSVRRQPEPSSEGKAENHRKQNHGGKERQCRDEKGETLVCEKTFT
jgi:hypothetical protein